MSIIIAVIMGLIVGFIAKLIMHGTAGPTGCLPTALLGIAGSVIAALVGQALGWYHQGQPAGFIASIIGAVFLLWIYRFLRK